MKREATNHTKMARFERRLDIRQYEAVGILELLWHLTGKESPAGNIGKLSDEDIAGAVGWDGDPAALTDALADSGWLDRHESYRLVIHDWSHHCEDSVHAKLARSRTLFVDGTTPSLRKLNKIERESAEIAIQTGAFRAPDGRIMPPTGAFMPHNAAVGRPTGANPTLPNPTLPNPTTPPPVAAAVVVAFPSAHEFPQLAAAVRKVFQSADDQVISAIAQDGLQAYLSVDRPVGIPPDDAMLAAAVEVCTRESPNQKSPMLYRTTVPNTIRNWARDPPRKRGPPLSPKAQIVTDNLRRMHGQQQE